MRIGMVNAGSLGEGWWCCFLGGVAGLVAARGGEAGGEGGE